mmetsp:Transcript_20249/g.56980  ORF Transcript_20249/g.56980 Transcript_20249/m.56980 type:complete len:100 (+) Transcript_20249:202-501(+)
MSAVSFYLRWSCLVQRSRPLSILEKITIRKTPSLDQVNVVGENSIIHTDKKAGIVAAKGHSSNMLIPITSTSHNLLCCKISCIHKVYKPHVFREGQQIG